MSSPTLALFSAVSRRVDEPLLLLRPDGRIAMSNAAAAALFQRSVAELSSTSLQQLVATPAADVERYLASCERTTGPLPTRLELSDETRGRRQVRCDGGLLSRDERELLLLRLREIGETDVFVLLGQKITELTQEVRRRKRAEAEQRVLYEEAARARAAAEDALRVREEFLSIASHELRNPLNALMLQLSALERTSSIRPEVVTARWLAERVAKARSQTQRMERLVADLLDVTRLTAGRLALELEEVPLRALVERVVEQERELVAGQEITLAPGPDVIVRCDAQRIEQVMINLVSNAVKYGKGNPVAVSLRADGDRVSIEVADRGIGIPAEDCARIFGRFERAVSTRNHGGFGLGLWIARQIVEAHGGNIGVQSVLNAGSSFRLTLPLRAKPGEV